MDSRGITPAMLDEMILQEEAKMLRQESEDR